MVSGFSTVLDERITGYLDRWQSCLTEGGFELPELSQISSGFILVYSWQFARNKPA
jgi:hypothetical protein